MRQQRLCHLKAYTILCIALLAFGAFPIVAGGPPPDAPLEPAPAALAAFSGYVYESSGGRDRPLSEVEVALYGSNDSGVQGELLDRTETGPDGSYSLLIPATVWEFYNIMEWNLPGYRSDRAESIAGEVITPDWTQYTYPLTRKALHGNNFWDFAPPTFTPTPTPTPIATPTSTRTTTPTATKTVTVTPTRTPTGPVLHRICASADAFVKKSQPQQNYGDASFLDLGFLQEGSIEITRRGFVRFDLTSIPAGSQIIRAYIGLGMSDAYGVSPVSLALHIVREPWDEHTITWENQPVFAGSPFVQAVVDKTIPQLVSWDVTELARDWLLDPRGNFGVAIIGPESGGDWARVFESREGSYCPELVLNLIPGGTIPTSTVTPTRTSLCIYPDEAGNSPATADYLSLFSEKVGYICPSGDEDWYQFPAQNQNEIIVRLPNPPTDYDLTLLNSDGYGAAWSSNGGTASEFIRYYADRSGYWKVGVRGKTIPDWSKHNPYSLRVDV